MQNLDLQSKTKVLRTSMTPWESRLWYYLRGGRFLGLKFKRQVPLDKYIVDFCCQEKKLIIELDGGQHNQENQNRRDLERQNYLEARGYKVLRFWNNDLSSNIDGALQKIRDAIDLSPDLSPSPGERNK